MRELIIDNFAGGGGASTGIEMALGRSPDIAINHDAWAVAMHKANHSDTTHYTEDVFNIDPAGVTNGMPVGLAWFSPDCKHFSKAKGGKPRSKKIRGLAWVTVKWAATVRPRVIILENVEEFQDWGPLLSDGLPCPMRKGKTFQNFIARLRNLGYAVEWRELRACDYGAPTIRKRLFLIARCDGKPIAWPYPTHAAPGEADGLILKPWRTAAECIDWSIPCPSIFLNKEEARALRVKRPLADATLRRIARGIDRYVINSADPFIVPLTHQGSDRVESIRDPMRTVTGAHRGEKALCVPILTECANGSSPRAWRADEPLRTQCAEVKGGHFALCQAFLAKHFTGVVGADLRNPTPTVTAVDHNSLVVSHLSKLYGTTTGQDCREPMHTITGQGNHIAEVRAFLVKYYGNEKEGVSFREPMHTVTARDRLGIVTVDCIDYVITDIGMRMLRPRELYRAQGFPETYTIECQLDGKQITQEAQVRMVGNSVCPPMASALVAANVPELSTIQLAA